MTGSGQGSLQRGWTASGSAPDLVDFASPLQGSASWDVRHPPLPMPRQAAPTLPELERQALLDALERTRWNVSRAARELDISRDALRYRMAKHGLAGEPEA
jgi:transcriptional regulator of acetoin/glycerol metabolism